MAQAKEITVPDIGDFDAVDVIEVLVKPGDQVHAEDSLITLESDKATMEVPCPEAGKVTEVLVSTGDKVAEGTPIIRLEPAQDGADDEPEQARQEEARSQDGGASPSDDAGAEREEETTDEAPVQAPPEPPEVTATQPPTRHAAQPGGADAEAIDHERHRLAHASPSVRRFARELGVDLSRVKGSGPKDRIVKEDVQAFVKGIMQGAPTGAAAATGTAPGAGGGIPAVEVPDFSRFGEVERQELTRIQKISGPHLHKSWLNVPHVTQFDEADITAMEAFRQSMKQEAEARGVRLTPLAFLIRAVVAALKEHPRFNSSLAPEGDALIVKKYYNIGVAVDTPGGLVVPVVKGADQLGIYELAEELARLSRKARDGKLSPGEMQGSNFSISSLGGISGTAFTPIVNAPEVAILGVSKSQTKPVWNGSEFEPRLMLPLSLSYDHRVIDGAMAARFTGFLNQVLGDIRRLLL
jgi:pyruvate dehydrogenase E2 component (dihydrolipoamide acetyltransferase)